MGRRCCKYVVLDTAGLGIVMHVCCSHILCIHMVHTHGVYIFHTCMWCTHTLLSWSRMLPPVLTAGHVWDIGLQQVSLTTGLPHHLDGNLPQLRLLLLSYIVLHLLPATNAMAHLGCICRRSKRKGACRCLQLPATCHRVRAHKQLKGNSKATIAGSSGGICIPH